MSLARYGSRRSGSGPFSCLWVTLAGLGLLAGVGLAAFLAIPRVAEVYPRAGAQSVSDRTPVRLTFNRPMDPASVEAALTITPPWPGSLAWEGDTLSFIPAAPWPLSTTVTITLAGARSQRGLPLLGAQTWSFTIGERRLAYLAGAPEANLWLVPITSPASAQPITAEPVGIYDFAISPDGTEFVYAARRPDGGADLRRVGVDGSSAADLVLCPGEACVSPAFSPDGRLLAYQRQVLVEGLTGSSSLGASHVYLHNLATGADQQVSESEARFPRWAPDGRLSFLDTGRQAIVVQDQVSGAVTYIPNASGEMGTWLPGGDALVYPELVFPPKTTPDPASLGQESESIGSFYSYLTRVTIATNALQNLSGQGVVDDASPAISPSGNWLAFGRKLQVAGQWTPGRQLWLMRPDGSAAHALTADPLYNHSAFTWSSDGTQLAYMRFNTANPGEAAEIWLVDIDSAGLPGTGDAGPRRLAAGFLPEWLP